MPRRSPARQKLTPSYDRSCRTTTRITCLIAEEDARAFARAIPAVGYSDGCDVATARTIGMCCSNLAPLDLAPLGTIRRDLSRIHQALEEKCSL